MDIKYNNTVPFEVVSELIGQIYQAGLDGHWADVMDRVIALTASNKAFFFFQKLDQSTPLVLEFRSTFDFPYEAYSAYQKRTLEDPLYQTMSNMLEGDCMELTSNIDIETFEQTDFYRDFYLPFKTKYSIASLLARDANHESIFAINRGQDDPQYEQQDLELVTLLTPHLSRAVQIYKDLSLYKQYSAISKSILDQSDKGILVCDENGRILISNVFANQELEGHDDIKVIDQRLRLSPSAYDKRLQQCLSQCVSQPNMSAIQESILLERQGGEIFLITVTPLNQKSNFVDIDQPCCLVTLTKQNAIRWSTLMKEFGLTPKELLLIQAINRKKKLQQLTTEMGVTYNTLATHLKAIYKKMRIHSQAELMVILGLFRT